jgi:hypothetical protein
MLYASIILTRLNADFVAMAARSLNEMWMLLAPSASWSCEASAPRNPDPTTLSLDRMPPSGADLRRAYHRVAKVARPDAGGSADAFRAVSEAFGRLLQSNTKTL